MAQYQAAFYTDRFQAFWQKHHDREKVEGLLRALSYFELDMPAPQPTRRSFHPILAVAHNLIVRGLPTRASVAVEEVLADVLQRTHRVEKNGKIAFPSAQYDEKFENALWRALHLIDPRIQRPDQFEEFANWTEKTELGYEDSFFQYHVSAYLGNYLLQVLQPQRRLASVLEPDAELQKTFDDLFPHSHQRFEDDVVDFVLEMPFRVKGYRGIMIEFDTLDHATYPRRELDQAIAQATQEQGWYPTVRIDEDNYNDIRRQLQPVNKLTAFGYFEQLKQNYEYPLYRNDEGLDALQTVLSPIGVARLQRTILELVRAGHLSMQAAEWRIAVIERDVPCAQLALLDLHQLILHLFVLHGEGLEGSNMQALPDIRLQVYHTPDFDNAKLNRAIPGSKLLADFDQQTPFDVLIDLALLQRPGVRALVPPHQARHYVRIRSAFVPDSKLGYDVARPIEYNTLFKTQLGADKQVHPQVAKALDYLVQSIFRVNTLRPQQVQALDFALQRRPFALLLPPGTGKTLVFQLAMLLQPAPSLVITPLTTLTKNQLDGLWQQGIERLHWINTGLSSDQGVQTALARFASGQTLFNYVAPDWFRKRRFRAALQQLVQQHAVAYCAIDEIHCASEWSHDFRQGYFRLPQLVARLVPGVALMGFSGTAFNNTVADIQAQLGISEGATLRQPIDPQRFDSEVLLVDLPRTRQSAVFSLAKEQLASRKQVKALQLADELTKRGEKVFFFTPYNRGLLGITDPNNDGLADKLRAQFPQLSVGAFVGTDPDYTNSESEAPSVEALNTSRDTYSRFANNQTDIVVASSALGVGIHSEAMQNLVHINMPASIESFVQRNGRGNRNGRPTRSVILYNNQPFERSDDELLLAPDGTQSTETRTWQTTIDKQVLLDFHWARFRGAKFDIETIFELLTEIRYDDLYPYDDLRRWLERRYNVAISFLLHTDEEPRRLLVFVNRINLVIVRFDAELSYTALNTDISYAESLCHDLRQYLLSSPAGDRHAWFVGRHRRPAQKGIEATMAEFERSQKIFQETTKPRLTVPYENDVLARIAELLQTTCSGVFTEQVVLEAFQYAQSAREFINQLQKTANVQVQTPQIDLPARLAELFYQVRRRDNTLTAIRQLTVLGIVEDFTLNESQRTVETTLSPVGNEYYVIQLFRLLQRYLSDEVAHRVFADIYQYNEPTVLRQCIRYYIDWVYRELAPSRRAAIEAMAQACDEVLQPELTAGELRFGDLVQLHLQGKYAHPAHQPNLLADTDNLSQYSVETLFEYVQHAGPQRQNLYHLQGSAQMLQAKHPDNYLLLMLQAYTQWALAPTDAQELATALERFGQALRLARQRHGYSAEEWASEIDRTTNWLVQQLPKLKHLRTAIVLKLHQAWLRDFNRNFLRS